MTANISDLITDTAVGNHWSDSVALPSYRAAATRETLISIQIKVLTAKSQNERSTVGQIAQATKTTRPKAAQAVRVIDRAPKCCWQSLTQ